MRHIFTKITRIMYFLWWIQLITDRKFHKLIKFPHIRLTSEELQYFRIFILCLAFNDVFLYFFLSHPMPFISPYPYVIHVSLSLWHSCLPIPMPFMSPYPYAIHIISRWVTLGLPLHPNERRIFIRANIVYVQVKWLVKTFKSAEIKVLFFLKIIAFRAIESRTGLCFCCYIRLNIHELISTEPFSFNYSFTF